MPRRGPSRLSKAWLEERHACASQLDPFVEECGDDAKPSRVVFERAQARGLNVIWGCVRLMEAADRPAFIAFTLEVRVPAVDALLERDPEDRIRRQAERDVATDTALTAPTAEDAELAARHALRSTSGAGLDEGPVREAMEDFLAAAILGDR